MKVADLQQFISALVTPFKAVGGSDKVCNELRQTVELLEPFHDKTVAELGELLRMIDDFQRNGRWPEPPAPAKGSRKTGVAKPPKLTVGEAAQKVMALLERITNPELEYAVIDAELRRLDALTIADLRKVAQEVGMTIPSKLKKPDILAEIRRRVRDRKGSYERARFGSQPREARQPHLQV